jgi:outer membrane immunogenic protein
MTECTDGQDTSEDWLRDWNSFDGHSVVGGILMRTLITAGILALSAAINPASAQAPAWTWTGFYLGANFGGGWTNSNWTTTITGTLGDLQRTGTNSNTSNGGGILGGGQIGYNYEFPSHWVAGIEADIDGAHLTSSKSLCLTVVTVVCGNRDTQIEDFGTVRARLGYAFDNILVYGTGGWAWGNISNATQTTCLGTECPATSALKPQIPTSSSSATPSGWAAGAGIEWGFLPNWALRAEYLHLQLNGVTEDRSGFLGPARPVFVTAHQSSDLGVDAVRVGVSYLFNWP